MHHAGVGRENMTSTFSRVAILTSGLLWPRQLSIVEGHAYFMQPVSRNLFFSPAFQTW